MGTDGCQKPSMIDRPTEKERESDGDGGKRGRTIKGRRGIGWLC